MTINFNGGTPADAAGALMVATSGGVASVAGLLYDAENALVVADGGVIAGYAPGGMPVTATGALCAAYGGVPVRYLAGIPFDANGRVCMVAPVPPADPEAFDNGFDDPAFG